MLSEKNVLLHIKIACKSNGKQIQTDQQSLALKDDSVTLVKTEVDILDWGGPVQLYSYLYLFCWIFQYFLHVFDEVVEVVAKSIHYLL